MLKTVDSRQLTENEVLDHFPQGSIWTEKIGITRALVQHLREQIIMGILPPGSPLIENQLALELGISRPPLREALRVLESEGLIKNVPRKGSLVSELSIDDFVEATQIRIMIELFAVDLLQEKNIRNCSLLDRYLEGPDILFPPSESDPPEKKLAKLTNSRLYHSKIIEATGNLKLIQFYSTIFYTIERYQFFYAFGAKSAKDSGMEDHMAVIEYIAKGDYEKAKIRLRKHIKHFSDKIIKGMTMKKSPESGYPRP
jgi:DNA-binding GntR family transcriptional regulator